MNIVITDGYTVNPGDTGWQAIEKFGTVTVYDRTPAGSIVDRCRDAAIILTNKVPFNRETIHRLPHLKLICVTATGYNVIDTATAKEKGITVCNVPAYGTHSVAQHTIALLLELTNHVGVHAAAVSNGEWGTAKDWCFTKAPVIELAGKTLGIIGLGNIGLQTAQVARALGMNIIYYSRTQKNNSVATYKNLEEVFSESDFISLHCPLTAGNNQFINKNLLQQMKPSAFLINTSRGQLLNEQDVADALNNEQVAGAALDVLSTEPPSPDNPLLKAKNCLITPHNAWISREARQRIIDTTAENIKVFLEGKPVNVV